MTAASSIRGFVLATLLAGVCAASSGAAATPTSTTALTVTPAATTVGDTVTLTATVSVTGVSGALDGRVEFDANTNTSTGVTQTPIASAEIEGSAPTAQATVQVSDLAAGTYAITATYTPSQTLQFQLLPSSTSAAVLETVSGVALNATAMTLTGPQTLTSGAAATFSATVTRTSAPGTPSGVVTFADNGVFLDQAALDSTGTATITHMGFVAGTNVITASYAGNAVDHSAFASLTRDVPAPATAVQTQTTVTATPNPVGAGAVVRLTAAVVQTGRQTTPPAGPVVTFTTADGVFLGQAPLDATGHATIAVGGWLVGTYEVTASYVGDTTDEASSGAVQLTVTAAGATLPVLTVTAPSPTTTYGGAPPALAPAYSGFVGGDTPASLTSPATCTTAATSASPAGSYPVICSGAVDPDYTIRYVDGTLTVARAALTATADDELATTGRPLPPLTATIAGFVNGDTAQSVGLVVTCSTTATPTSAPGTYPITCAGPSTTTNYTVSYSGGTLTLVPGVIACPTTKENVKGTAGGRCESLLADPTPSPRTTVAAGQTLSILYTDDRPIGTGALAPTALLGTRTLLPVTVTPTSSKPPTYVDDNEKDGEPPVRNQDLLTFTLPATLAPGTYSILVTAHDVDGDVDQWTWPVTVASGEPKPRPKG